jgi:uncharacterized protein YgiM (DUF1202 family)
MKITGPLIAVGIALAVALSGTARAETMSVQVKMGQLRATPSFIGKIVGAVAYGDRVEILQTQGEWIKVQAAGRSGWIHRSALSTKRISMTAGTQTAKTGASGDEISLAGKGFNSDVEREFKSEKNIDYSWVDWMEEIKISPTEAQAFLRAGDVTPTQGGAQ